MQQSTSNHSAFGSTVHLISETSNPNAENVQRNENVTKHYKKRWLILALFFFLTMSNAFQWIQYAVINNVVTKFYSVNAFWVDATSMIWMIVYIPFIFPATMFMDRFGLRLTVIMGALGNCLGAWIKCFSAFPTGFYLTFLGQTVSSIAQTFILNVPPRLAALWFGSKQVSTANSIGVLGNQLGCAIGFLVPPLVIKYYIPFNYEPPKPSPFIRNASTIGPFEFFDDFPKWTTNDSSDEQFFRKTPGQLQIIFYASAAFNTIILVCIFLFFKKAPEIPPSLAQLAAVARPETSYLQSLTEFFKNLNFSLLILSYGLLAGALYAFNTLLNQIVLNYFPGNDVVVGWIGFVIILTGMLGSVFLGVWLDFTKLFRLTMVGVSVLSLISMMLFAFTLYLDRLLFVYLSASLLGFFLSGYLPIGYEFGIEITYPLSEGTSSGLLNASTQFFGIIFIIVMQFLKEANQVLACNLVVALALFIGTIISFFIKLDLKRHKIEHGGETANDEPRFSPDYHSID